MEVLAILLVAVVGGASLLGYRAYVERRDAALTEVSGGWRIRTHLPLDPGPPYSLFSNSLVLSMPSDVMEGIEEGFEVSYFTLAEGRRSHGPPIQRPAAIVQLPVASPVFRYDASGMNGGPAAADALRVRHGAHGGIGPRTAEVLALARDVTVEAVGQAVLIRSTGARPEVVSRLTMQLAKALVADATAGTA